MLMETDCYTIHAYPNRLSQAYNSYKFRQHYNLHFLRGKKPALPTR